jgi:hypothetical protein
MWVSISAILLGLWAAFGAARTAAAGDFSDLGYCEDTVIQSAGFDECAGTLLYNHDDSFENGYCWEGGGILPPYYGAWGEGYDLGAVTIECGVFWFTSGSYGDPATIDLYVWDGGVHGPPASVLHMVAGVVIPSLPFWPTIGRIDLELGTCVNGAFTVGYWEDNSSQMCVIYCAADENGSGGHPWTCIAPGIGYPTGWQHPNVVHPNCVSMGIGVTVTNTPSPAESETWGAIKSMFRQ